MLTLDPLRFLMFPVSVANRGCPLITASEHVSDCATGPSGSVGGSVKSCVPIMGKAVMVGTISSRLSAARILLLLSRIDNSTRLRSRTNPPNGILGVPSIIHAPYSGCHAHASLRLSDLPLLSSLPRRVSSTSAPRSEIFTLLRSLSTLRI